MDQVISKILDTLIGILRIYFFIIVLAGVILAILFPLIIISKLIFH